MADSIDSLVKMSLPMREAPPIERRDEVKMQKTEETRVQSYDSTMTAFENEALAAAHEVPAEPDEVGEVLAASEPLWAKLKAKLHASPCGEAARKLISNHEAVLRDVTNPAPVSQMDVPRVPVAQAKLAAETRDHHGAHDPSKVAGSQVYTPSASVTRRRTMCGGPLSLS